MKKMKRFLCYCYFMTMAVMLFFGSKLMVSADSFIPVYPEHKIAVKSPEGTSMEVTYKYVSSSDGYFQCDFASEGNDDWKIYIKDASGKVLEDYYWNNTGHLISDKFPVGKGQVHYITVSKYYDGSGDSEYSLLLHQTNSNVWEKEYNDSRSTANTREVNRDYYGTLYYNDDDWYKFTMPADGYATVSLAQEDLFSSSHPDYQMVIMDKNGNKLSNDYGYNLNSVRLSYKKGTVLYINICNGYQAAFNPYKLRVNFVKTNYYEKENNDSSSTATTIQAGKKYTGCINYYHDDADYYKFTLKKPMKITIYFGPEDLSSTGEWRVELKNFKNEPFKLFEGERREKKSGYLKKGTYYIVVTSRYHVADKLYQLSLSTRGFSLTKPVLKSCKIKREYSYWHDDLLFKIKLKKKSKTADGYQVLVSGNKKMKKADSCMKIEGNKASKTVNDVSSHYKGKKKYVAVRAYVKDIFGNYITSNISNKIQIKIPKKK